MPDRSNAYRIIVEAVSYDEAIELAKNEAESVINETGDQFKPGFLFIEIPL